MRGPIYVRRSAFVVPELAATDIQRDRLTARAKFYQSHHANDAPGVPRTDHLKDFGEGPDAYIGDVSPEGRCIHREKES